MERTQLFDLMGELKLYGMKAAFDEIMATAVKRQHEPQRIVGDLLTAEVNEKQRSVTSSLLPSCRSPRISTTSSSPAPRSTRRSFAISPAAASLPNDATLFWSAAPVPARPIWPSRLREAAFAAARAAGSTTSSIWSTGSRARPATDAKAGSQNI